MSGDAQKIVVSGDAQNIIDRFAGLAERFLPPRDPFARTLWRVRRRTGRKRGVTRTMKRAFSLMDAPETAEAGRLLFAAVAAREGWRGAARDAFAKVSDATLLRYALPEAAAALAASDEENRGRAKALLRSGFETWGKIRSRLSAARRLQLAAASAALGDAEAFELFIAGLVAPEADALKRDFAERQRAATGEPVWLTVNGSFGRELWPGQYDFPFTGNIRPLFTSFHLADAEILNEETLKYLRVFAPIGCRDLLTARLLRGAGVMAFVGSEVVSGDAQKIIVPQPVLDAIREGKTEAEVYALWRKTTAPAMKRTDTMIAERNAKYPLREFPMSDLGLSRIPVQAFGPASNPKNKPVHLLFAFDANLAEHFPGTMEGIWRHTTRPLVVHIFGRGLTAAMFECWAALFRRTGGAQKGGVSGDAQKGSAVRFIHHDLSGVAYPKAAQTEMWDYITVSSWDRLLAPALLPDLERAVWLDVDLLVRKDVSPLFEIELGDAPLAACDGTELGVYNAAKFPWIDLAWGNAEAFREAFFSGGSPPLRASGGSPHLRASGATVFRTFNAGVLVMNLARMRRERAVEKTLAFVATCSANDQMALNLYARARRKPLPQEWNAIPFHNPLDDPAIVHFAGIPKPWAAGWSVGFWREWRQNAASASRRSRDALCN